jgi:zinc/manganese transport system substrate-binding protein
MRFNMQRKKLVRTGCLGLVTAAVLLAGCGKSSTAQLDQPTSQAGTQSTAVKAPTGKIKAVAAENFYGEVVQAVGGNQVQVTSILTNPAADPHDYEPTPEASKAVSDAQLIVYTGIGYDSWMDKLLHAGSSNANGTKISVGSDLLGKKEGDNPHVWYDPTAMPKVANAVADSLSKLEPAKADLFKNNAKAYIASLDPLQKQVAKLKSNGLVTIDVSEPVFDYMAQALNLTIANKEFAKAVEQGTDPAPKSIAQIQRDMKEKKIKLFINNTQAESPTVKNFVDQAQSSNIPVVGVTETEPAGKNYLQWMMDQLNEVEKGLTQK